MEGNVLVTGANGFIGNAIVTHLVTQKNVNVVSTVFDQHKNINCCAHHVVRGDIRDYKFISRVVGDYEINHVIHLASQSIVRVCANDPMTAYDINVMGTVALLEACRTVGKNTVKSVVVSTSDKAFGHSVVPYNETTELKPLYTYETSKACQDLITQSYFHNYGVPTKVARCSNVYGPGDNNFSRIIPNSIRLVKNGKSPIMYNGVHNFIREFIYVADVISAFEVISDFGLSGEVYCVGGTGHQKILDVIKMIVELMDSDVEIIIEDKPSNLKEISEQWIDSSKLCALGWSPKYSLKDGLKETIKYYTMQG